MTKKEHALVPLFEKFINHSYKGKRLKPDGSRIKPQTVDNYNYVLRYLKEYQTEYGVVLRIKVINSQNKRVFTAERNHWQNFTCSLPTICTIKRIVTIIMWGGL